MSRLTGLLCAAALFAAAGCGTRSGGFDPHDPQVVAALDSIMSATMEAAAGADADGVTALAEGGELTLVTGDVMLEGLDRIRESFRRTYAGVDHQTQTVEEKQVRLIAPDVALYSVVGEGTYTDNAGVTSDPVGLGVTVVFVRENGAWRACHVHQSVAH